MAFDVLGEAVRNNARWCDAVCRTHGNPGRTDDDAWSVPRRSPPLYPDAVSLRPGAGARLLDRIDAGPGVSVKDSFATLDLTPYGFDVLFDADWIFRPPGAVPTADFVVDPTAPAVTPVTAPEDLAAWAAALGGGDVFRPALLADPAVTVLALRDADGTIAAGAAVNRSGPVLGVSNVFAATVEPEQVWRAVVARFPDTPLVGYESGDDLRLAAQVGFRTVGPLRIWLRP